MPGVPPVRLSMVVCDEVVRNDASGKTTLVGSFRSISARSYPTVQDRLTVWLELTSGHGRARMLLGLRRLSSDRPDGELLFESEVALDFPDPLTVVDFSLDVSRLEFPAPGDYRFRLESAGILIAERRIEVVRPRQKGVR